MIRLIVISSTIAVIGIYFFVWAVLDIASRDDDRFDR